MSKIYNIAWIFFRPVFQLMFPHKIHGRENVPAEGGFVLCANHMSGFDPIFVAACLPRKRQVHYIAKKELWNNGLLKLLLNELKCIPVDRGNADLSAVRTSLQVIKEGHPLGIFPQGTRSRDNTPTPFLGGASMIALRAGVPVIPCYIDGPYKLFRRSDVFFGKPIELSDFGRRCDSETLAKVTARIEQGVWGLRTK